MDRRAILLSSTCVFALLAWIFHSPPDPEKKLRSEIERRLESLNRGDHQKMLEIMSPEFIALLQENYLPLERLLQIAHHLDMTERHYYRIKSIERFIPDDYAEVTLLRSGPDENWNFGEIFPLPLRWMDGHWKIAGKFRSNREWNFPIE